MKLSTTSAALVLAFTSSVSAAPATYSAEKGLSAREADNVAQAIAVLNEYTAKRDQIPADELAARDYPIVTEILTLVKDSNLAPTIVQWIIDNDTTSLALTTVIVDIIKAGYINIDALFKALNDSGLLVQIIKDVINDCEFYATIYKIALKYISNLAEEIAEKLTGSSKRELGLVEAPLKVNVNSPAKLKRADTLTELLESLNKSGLVDQVVAQLVTDEQFYYWGADLISQLFSSGALTLSEVIEALASSGTLTTLFENFFNYDTLKTVIVNALAAAFGNCNSSSTLATTTATSSTTGTATATSTDTATSTSSTTKNAACKKKKRNYH